MIVGLVPIFSHEVLAYPDPVLSESDCFARHHVQATPRKPLTPLVCATVSSEEYVDVLTAGRNAAITSDRKNLARNQPEKAVNIRPSPGSEDWTFADWPRCVTGAS